MRQAKPKPRTHNPYRQAVTDALKNLLDHSASQDEVQERLNTAVLCSDPACDPSLYPYCPHTRKLGTALAAYRTSLSPPVYADVIENLRAALPDAWQARVDAASAAQAPASA